MTSRRSGAAVLAAALLAVLTWWLLDSGTTTVGGAELRYDDGLPVVALDDLPPEAAATVELIDAGGPFPHEQDDETFFNREGLLPEAPAGHYREYTVETPGSDDRGARRIVAGRDGALYWTSDHYASFSRIDRTDG